MVYRMRYPFDRMEGGHRRLGWILAILTVVTFAALAVVDLQTFNDHAPMGQVSIQFAGTNANATAIVEQWVDDGVLHLAGASVGLDYLFLIAYGVLIAFLGSRLAKRAHPTREVRWMTLGVLVAWLGVAASFLDAVEGVLLLGLIGDPANGPAGAVTGVAAAKFTFILISVAVIVTGVFAVEGGTSEE